MISLSALSPFVNINSQIMFFKQFPMFSCRFTSLCTPLQIFLGFVSSKTVVPQPHDRIDSELTVFPW